MASIYLQPKSRFYWLKYRKPDGSIARFSTKCDSSNPLGVRKAQIMESEFTTRERSYGSAADASGWSWVEQFLRTTYHARQSTLERFLNIWFSLHRFIQEKQIAAPAFFTRQHCFDYMAWRAQPNKKIGKWRACHNTALLELKTLRIILNEAVVRELCNGNPCVKLGIHREAPRRSPELTNEQIDIIRQRIAAVTDAKQREFLEITFEIARWQGCRLNATRLNPLRDVVINPGGHSTIRFVSKGKDFETMLHQQLVPLFTRLKAEKRTCTWEPPQGARRSWASLQWVRFLDHSGLRKEIPDFTHKAFRVTVITRMARKGVPLSKSMEYVKHASTTVHLVYTRLTQEDLGDCGKAVE